MFDIKDINNKQINILRKVPLKIYSFTVIMVITLVGFIFLGNFFYYSKSQNCIVTIVEDDSKTYFQTTISKRLLSTLDKCQLIINNKEYNFEIVNLKQNNYDNNYSMIFVLDEELDISDEKYIICSFKTKKTTLFKEIYEKIKEDLDK